MSNVLDAQKLLTSAHELFLQREAVVGGGERFQEVDAQYSKALDEFFAAAYPKAMSRENGKQLAEEYLKVKRRPKPDREACFEIEDYALKLCDGVFPFRRKLWSFTARLAVHALYGTSLSPKMPSAVITWPADLKLALVVDLAGSIESILVHGQLEGLPDWQAKVQAEIEHRLKNVGQWERYRTKENMQLEMAGAYKEYERLDREFEDTDKLVKELRSQGLSVEEEAKLQGIRTEFGYHYEQVEAIFGTRFSDLFAHYTNGQEKTKAALSTYLRAKKDWEDYEFEMPFDCRVGYENVVDAKAFKVGLEKIFDFQRAFDQSSALLWIKFGTLNLDWFNDCIQAVKGVLRNRRALGIDTLIRMRSATDSYIDVKLFTTTPWLNLNKQSPGGSSFTGVFRQAPDWLRLSKGQWRMIASC